MYDAQMQFDPLTFGDLVYPRCEIAHDDFVILANVGFNLKGL